MGKAKRMKWELADYHFKCWHRAVTWSTIRVAWTQSMQLSDAKVRKCYTYASIQKVFFLYFEASFMSKPSYAC